MNEISAHFARSGRPCKVSDVNTFTALSLDIPDSSQQNVGANEFFKSLDIRKPPLLPTSLIRFGLVLSLFLAALAHLAQAQSADLDAEAVASVVHEFHVALEVGDAQVVSRLLASDAVILEIGDRETRKEYLEHHLQADFKFAQAVPTRRSKIDVTVNGEVAWAISTGLTQGTYLAKPVNMVGAELMVLSKTPAGWVIRSIHWSSRTSK